MWATERLGILECTMYIVLLRGSYSGGHGCYMLQGHNHHHHHHHRHRREAPRQGEGGNCMPQMGVPGGWSKTDEGPHQTNGPAEMN
jgi:hypothetical protein